MWKRCATCATGKGEIMLLDEIKKRAKKPVQPESSLEESFVESAPEPESVKSKLKIEKMQQCLHGRSCRHLKSEPPARPLCKKAEKSVFDLIECPIKQWGSS